MLADIPGRQLPAIPGSRFLNVSGLVALVALLLKLSSLPLKCFVYFLLPCPYIAHGP